MVRPLGVGTGVFRHPGRRGGHGEGADQPDGITHHTADEGAERYPLPESQAQRIRTLLGRTAEPFAASAHG
ncbi:hypothetical protein Nm8I071_24180 [Nonomuraea sp. TT08I-71]|nr:hypothetical protein Nm8I071_24180 [Nonomuraea sp. TT08I-71]